MAAIEPRVTVSTPFPWKPLPDWNEHASYRHEFSTPFSSFVKPKQVNHSFFPQFQKLPAELQVQVLSFCDMSTLFQCMRVSRILRKEASKFFWSDPHTYYEVHGQWLLDGGLPGLTYYALDILPYLEQIDVAWDRSAGIQVGIKELPSADSHSHSERAILVRKFWETLQERFPRVTRVIISSIKNYDDSAMLLDDLKTVVEKCPKGIHVFASSLWKPKEDSGLLKRQLWRNIQENDTTKVEMINATWTRHQILLPPRRFDGPVGEWWSC